jgi:hypothetical protein
LFLLPCRRSDTKKKCIWGGGIMGRLQHIILRPARYILIIRASLLGIIVAYPAGCGTEEEKNEYSNYTYYGNQILGKGPLYGDAMLSSVPNEQAIDTMIWAPGLDDGFIPQGITFAEGQILISAYQSMDPEIDNGPAKVFRVSPDTGEITGEFDLPPDVGHAGGLAYEGDGILYIAEPMKPAAGEKGKIYRIDLPMALEDGNCENAVTGKVILSEVMGPCFLTYDGAFLWFGLWAADDSVTPKIYKADPERLFEGWPSVPEVFPEEAVTSFEIDERTQGGTFDSEGNLWVSQSCSKWGKVQKLDPSNGRVLEEYELMAGIEGMALSGEGDIWAVSEAGAIKYYGWQTYYPVIFQMYPSELKE